MKILLVETSPIGKNDVTVHARNSVVLAEFLSINHTCYLVWGDLSLANIEEQFDFIIFISATFYFKFEPFIALMDKQKKCKVGWITNEHDLFMQNFLKNRGVDFIIANLEEWGVKKAHKHDKFLMTNLNTLIAQPRNPVVEKQYNIVYYGTHRKWRVIYFEKYLIKDLILSTSKKNVKKFLLDNCDCYLTDKLSWEKNNETLNLFKASLYIEDTINHKLYNHLANRFYEALYCNCSVFFDRSCINTITKSNHEIDDFFIIDSYQELDEKINNIDANLIENFFQVNTEIALQDKTKTLMEIENFLLNY